MQKPPLLTLAVCLVGLSPAQAQSDMPNRGIAPELIGTGAIENSIRWGRTRSDSDPSAPGNPDVAFVSVTTLAAPPVARKAYERAAREMGKERPDVGRAATELQKAVTQYPSFAAAWYFLGGIRLVLNDADSARRAFESALAADPKFPYPYLPLAAIELSARRFAEAARLTDSVLQFDHRLFQAHYYRALANSTLGRYEKARQSIREIVDSGNDRLYPGVHAILAVILTKESDFPSAANEYRRFLELDPGSPAAGSAREYLATWRAAALIP
jgi:tetratricopeptide (TPR) repeat protein